MACGAIIIHVYCFMRKLFLFLVVLCTCVSINAQVSVDDYIGTWRGEKGDTTFTIKLVKGDVIYNSIIHLMGGYQVTVKGKYTDNYLKIPSKWDSSKSFREQGIYISAAYSYERPQRLSITILDQQKKHFNGEGISGGRAEYIYPNKLHWTLNEKMGIYMKIEGDENYGEVQPIGFSVPTDIIMIRVE